MLFWELLKFVSRLVEYFQLLKHERTLYYVSIDRYEQMKNEEEEKKNTISLKRCGTTIKKPKKFEFTHINGLRGGNKTAMAEERSRVSTSLT